jgi:hypothetical protein
VKIFLSWSGERSKYIAQQLHWWGRTRGTPADRFAARSPTTQNERDTFQAVVVQCKRRVHHELCVPDQPLTDTCSALIHRRVVRHALVELGYLDITRKSIPQPIHTAKCARIT